LIAPQESAPFGDWVALFFEADQSASILDKKEHSHFIRQTSATDFEVKMGNDWFLAKLIHQSDTKKKCEQALDTFLEKKVFDHNACVEEEEEDRNENKEEHQGRNNSNLSTNLIPIFDLFLSLVKGNFNRSCRIQLHLV
jgi:hypothetical protein